MQPPASHIPGIRFRAELGVNETYDVLYLGGELDLEVIEPVEDFASAALEVSTRQRFVVDLADLSFCGSQGLTLFLRLDRAAKSHGQEFVLRHPDPMLIHLLELTMLDEELMVEA